MRSGDYLDLQNGTVIDERFEIVSLLGHGGIAVVYKAHQKSLNRFVAIKLLRLEVQADPPMQERLRRESLSLSRLRHAGIVSFYEFGIWNNQPYAVLELLEGQPLDEFINATGALDFETCLKIGKQICVALTCAHNQGVVHRDLKPGNIVLPTQDLSTGIKVIDFGLAKLLPEFDQSLQKLTQEGTTVGSVQYMSPEQCIGAAVDERADIYGLGATLYHCVSGHAPFEADNAMIMMMAHVNEQLRPLDRVHPSVESRKGEWQRILFKAMSKNVSDRYDTAQSMLADLQALELVSPSDLSIVGHSTAPPVSRFHRTTPHRWPLLALVPLLIFSAAVAYTYLKPSCGDVAGKVSPEVLLQSLSLTDTNEQRIAVLSVVLEQAKTDRRISPSQLIGAHRKLCDVYFKSGRLAEGWAVYNSSVLREYRAREGLHWHAMLAMAVDLASHDYLANIALAESVRAGAVTDIASEASSPTKGGCSPELFKALASMEVKHPSKQPSAHLYMEWFEKLLPFYAKEDLSIAGHTVPDLVLIATHHADPQSTESFLIRIAAICRNPDSDGWRHGLSSGYTVLSEQAVEPSQRSIHDRLLATAKRLVSGSAAPASAR